MASLKLILFSILCLFCGFVVSQDKYNEKCTITRGSGLVVDSCDSSQFLTCNSGYCGCSDPANQVYGFRYIRDDDKTNSRTKRSPKKGKGGIKSKGSSTTVIVVSHSHSSNNNNNNNNRKSGSGNREFSCFGRVGSQCVLNYNNIKVVPLNDKSLENTTTSNATTPTSTAVPDDVKINTTSTTSSTTVEATTIYPSTESATNSDSIANNTTSTTTVASSTTSMSSTTASPVADGLKDISKIPKCVRDAVCKRPQASTAAASVTNNGTSRYLVTIDEDPRLGICDCLPGFVVSRTNTCVALSNAASFSKELVSITGIVLFAFVSRLVKS